MVIGDRGDAPILTALAETGAIGSTVRQLAGRLAHPEPDVTRTLDALARRGRVLRIGRGLWILREYEALAGRAEFAGSDLYRTKFEVETGRPLGRYVGPITFSPNDRLPVHRWWPYVQGYSAEFVATLLASERLPRGATVLDPFAGSGTTLVEARKAGLRAIGAELLAPAALAARVKTTFELDPDLLHRAATRLVGRARRGRPAPMPFLRETRRHFLPRILHDLRRLRAEIPAEGSPLDDALRLAFGSILIPVSRLRRSPCLGYGRPDADTASLDVFATYLGAVATMAADLRSLRTQRDRWGPPAEVRTQDSRTLALPEASVDAAVTSPPYVNGMDYVMNYKLDLAWLGYVTSYADLARLRGASVACDNLPRAGLADFADPSRAVDPWLPPILEEIRHNVDRKGSYRRDDVHAVVARYFADLVPVLEGVHRALVPGGRFTLVVGDSLLAGAYVPGDLVLARLGRTSGFEIERVEVARSRRSGQRRSFVLRESIVTLVKPGRRREGRRATRPQR